MPAYTTEIRESGGRRQLVVALVLFVAAVSIAFLPTPRQQQVAAVVRATVLRPFVAVQGGFVGARNRAVDPGTLQRQLDSLVAVTTGHLTLADENRKLRSLLGLHDRIGAGWITANVLRAGTSGSESTFMLDVGSEQGVTRYAPVVAGQGIVGVVQEVYPNSAIAMDWTHPDFRVSAMDAQGTVYGIVRSRRGEFREEDRLEFDGTAFQARLEDGSAVVTSDLSGDWPRGVPIGKVEGLAEADAGWRKSYWLQPMIEVGSVTHVLVGVSPAKDLYGVWPIDQMLTDTEVAQQLQAREDSVQLLRNALAAPRPQRDSLVAALLLDGQSPFAGAAGVVPTDSTAPAEPGQTNGQTTGAPRTPADSAPRGSDGRASPGVTTGQPRTPTGEPAGAPARPTLPTGQPDSTTGRPDSTPRPDTAPRPTDTTPRRPDSLAPQPGAAPPGGRPGGTPGARPDTAFSALRLDPARSRNREGGADRR